MMKHTEQIGIHQLGESMYRSLVTFFEEIWAQDYAYKVAMARRCYNLNYALGDGKGPCRQMISQNALLLYAEEMAQRYRRYGNFEKILICDDILLYGRNISRVLYTLEELVADFLRKKSATDFSIDERRAIHVGLLDAVDIKVFAMSKYPSLVDTSYLWKVDPREELYDDMLLDLSEHISKFMRSLDIANTSYVPSLRTPARRSAVLKTSREDWRRQSWMYDGKKNTFFFQKVLFGGNHQLSCTRIIQINNPDQNSQNSQRMIGYVLFDHNVNLNVLDAFCGEIKKVLPKESCLEKILSTQSQYQRKQQTQLISYLLSAVALHDFWEAYFPQDSWKSRAGRDIDKTAGNFARIDEIAKEMKTLVEDVQRLEYIKECLHMTVLPSYDRTSEPEFAECWGVNKVAEKNICEVGMRSELDAYQCGRNLKKFDPFKNRSGEVPLWKYLDTMKEEGDYTGEEIKELAGILMLSSDGIMAVNQELNDDKMQCTLKAGELSTFIMPRRYHVFIPGLTMVERECWRLDQKPEQAVQGYLEFLTPRDKATQKETELLNGFKEEWPPYMKILYQCDKSIARWNIGLSSEDDWEKAGATSNFSHIMSEFEQEDYYLAQAKEYLRMNSSS